MIRKLTSGEYRLYSERSTLKPSGVATSGPSRAEVPPRSMNATCSISSDTGQGFGRDNGQRPFRLLTRAKIAGRLEEPQGIANIRRKLLLLGLRGRFVEL